MADGNDLQKLEIRIRSLEQSRPPDQGPEIQGLKLRVRDLEQELKAYQRMEELRRKQMDEKVDEIKATMNGRFDKIDTNVSKLVWLIVAGLVGGVLTFIIQGGLANVPT